MPNRATLWLTRPQLDSESLANHLNEFGLNSIVAPVLSVGTSFPDEFRAATAPDALLLTSRHAVPALAQKQDEWSHLPVYCVGEATAEHARNAGFTQTISGDSDVQGLLMRVVEKIPPQSRITYLSGDQTRVDVAALLGARGYTVEQFITYYAIAENTLPQSIVQAINESRLDGVVFFSPRSATIVTKLLSRAGLNEYTTRMNAFCLSLAVANAAASMPWREIISCSTPNNEVMQELIVSHKQHKLL